MKKLIASLAFLIAVLLLITLTSCASVEDRIDEVTAELNEEIFSLKKEIEKLGAEIKALEGENEALESAKAALEEELSTKEKELACSKGYHLFDGESEIDYDWETTYEYCTAAFDCGFCGKPATLNASNIALDENGTLVASFPGVPSTSISGVPYIESVSINTDSEAYDTLSNTFTISKDNSLVLTFSGVNLDTFQPSAVYNVAVGDDEYWYKFEYIYGITHGNSTVEKDKITFTLDQELLNEIFSDYTEEVYSFVLIRYSDNSVLMNTHIKVNVVKADDDDESDTPSDEWVVVSTPEELRAAIEIGGNIRLGGDIEHDDGFQFYRDTVLDLAGYDISVTNPNYIALLIDANVEISVGGDSSLISGRIFINSGVLKLVGNILVKATDDTAINGSTTLDLSEYTGDEIYLYTEYLENIYIPDGYAFYDTAGNRLSGHQSAKEEFYAYVRPDGYDPLAPDGESSEWVVVSTPEEFKAAIENGGRIRLGADIENSETPDIVKPTMIDLAGHSLATTGYGNYLLRIHANTEILDSVGGATIYNQIMINYGNFKLVGSIKFDTISTMLSGVGEIDLSGYTGDEIYTVYSEGMILPDGYACYDTRGQKLESPSNGTVIYIRIDDSGDLAE